MSSRPFERPLLPHPSSSGTQSGSTVRPRIQKASNACTECRTRRAKCTGGIPCQRCRQKKTHCVLDKESDRRRRGVLESRLEELERDRTLLVRLLDSIRDGSQNESGRLLNYIRSHSSVDDVRQFLSQDSPSGTSDPQDLNSPRYRVPAWPWTSLTNDSNYVSHLISLYLTWIHPVQRWIDRDLFIADMQGGDLNSRFCSPFLVNALLAVACCCHGQTPSSSSETGAVLPGGQEFYNEAKRLLDQEEGRLSLTSFQGRCGLYLGAWAMGTHMLAWQYLVDIADCVRKLMAQRNTIIARAKPDCQTLVRAFETAITGSFSVPSVAIPGFQQPPMLPEPAGYMPMAEDDNPDDLWLPYSVESETKLPLEPVPAHINSVLNKLSKLQEILWKISNNQLGESIEQICATKKELADTFGSSLTRWAIGLPECLTYGTLLNSTPTPAKIDLHLRYYSAIIAIYDSVPNIDHFASIGDNVQSIRLSSAQTICSLLDLFVSHWSVVHMPFTFIHYAHIALAVLLSDLDNASSKGLFRNVYTTIFTLSSRLPIAKEIKQLIHEQARQLHTDLPPEICNLDMQAEKDAA